MERTIKEFAARFSPDRQKNAIAEKEKMVLCPFPTLGDMLARFGEADTLEWLQMQLFDLSEFCGARGKLTSHQIVQLCDRFITSYAYIKVSEYLLFFGNMKSGKYGEFVGSIDPQRILWKFRNEFIAKDRADIIAKDEARRREKEREERSRGAVSWEEWCRMEGRDPKQNPIDALMSANKQRP